MLKGRVLLPGLLRLAVIVSLSSGAAAQNPLLDALDPSGAEEREAKARNRDEDRNPRLAIENALAEARA
jgi:hypothetical protein